MTIEFNPSKILKKAKPKGGFSKLVTRDLKVNRAILTAIERSGIISKEKITDVALSAIKTYKKSEKKLRNEGLSKLKALKQSYNDGALVESRIENSIVYEMAQKIKEAYKGVWFEWIPSDSMNPDPEHQLKYGKKFRIGKDEIPGERYGCRCGMRILTPDEEVLEL